MDLPGPREPDGLLDEFGWKHLASIQRELKADHVTPYVRMTTMCPWRFSSRSLTCLMDSPGPIS